MDEQASFEARAVLAPRRARTARLALLVPVIALIAIAWAGFSGPRSDPASADIADPTATAASRIVEGSTPAVAPGVGGQRPSQVIGLDVQRLDDVQPQGLGRDEVIAVAGWYVATAITNCPRLAALFRAGSLPEVRGDADELAFCERSGMLYTSRPDQDRFWNPGLPAVLVKLVVGVVVPPELEIIGSSGTEVVVVGRFVGSGGGCSTPAGCRELVVDHVAWTSGA